LREFSAEANYLKSRQGENPPEPVEDKEEDTSRLEDRSRVAIGVENSQEAKKKVDRRLR
jgi:hypothetical protein